MEMHFTPELEARLTHSAAQQGREADELVQDVLMRYFGQEARFAEAVKRGEAALHYVETQHQ
jgi:DNA-directed RNA polymerase specialized sigma24 family protein